MGSNITTAIICLATNRKFNFSKLIFDGMGLIVQGEGSTVLVESHHTPIGALSTSQSHFSPTLRIPIRHETEVLRPSSPSHTNVADKAVSTSVDVRHGGAPTTVISLEAGQGSGNIDQTPTMPHDSPLSRFNTLGSDEGSMTLQELMVLCTTLSKKVESLEKDLKQTKKIYGASYTKFIKKVKKLHKTVKSSQAKRRARIVIPDDEDDLEDSSKQGRKIAAIDQDPTISLLQQDAEIQERNGHDMEVDTAKPVYTSSVAVTTAIITVNTAIPARVSTVDDITMAETLVYIRKSAAKDKDKGKMVESETVQPKTKLQQEQERLSLEAAMRLQDEIDEEERQRIVKIHKIASSFNIKEWEEIQARVEADEELVVRLQAEERENYTKAKKARMITEFINQRKRRGVPELVADSSQAAVREARGTKRAADEEHGHQSSKKQKSGAARIWLEKEPPRSILTWDDLVSKFINQFFPPSKTTNLRNEITKFTQRFDETFSEALDRFKDLLRACPHHGFSELHQLDTFYNALTPKDQDSLNSAAGGNFLDKMPSDCLSIIERKSKVRYSRDKIVAKVSTNTPTSGVSPDVAELKDLVRALLLDKKGQNQSPAPVKAVEESCVVCGVNYNQGNTGYRPQMMSNQIRPPGFPPVANNQNVPRNNQNRFISNKNRGLISQPSVFQQPAYQAPAYQALAPQTHGFPKEDFSVYVKANDAVMKNMQTQGQNMQNQLTNFTGLMTKFVNSNTASTSSSGTLPSNTIANPKSDLKAITTRSEPETTKDTVIPTNNGNTEDVQPHVVPSKPVTSELANTPVSASKPNPQASIPYPSRRNDERNRENTGRSLIDVIKGELTLRVGKEAITFNLDQTSRYSANYNDMTVNRIDVIDMACEEYSQEVLGFSDTVSGGNPTPFYDPIISATSPTLTPFGDNDFLLEEVDAFLAVEDEPISSLPQSYLDPEGDILHLEAFLNDDPSPSPPPPNQRNYLPEVRKELKICEAKSEKSSVDEPPVVELKALPPHLEYAFLEGDDKFPVIIAKDLSVEEKKIQINELNELRDQAYENSLIYKEKTKRIHDSKIKNHVFNIGDRVLLFNSRLKIFSSKLKSRWSGPFTISHVFPYGTVELSQPNGPNFKVNGHRSKHYFGEDIPLSVVLDLQNFANDHQSQELGQAE
nr:reverse transcriptase domain-containing protein [Tanacetum cinerariifolium]